MARWTRCNECGFILDNYLETAEQDWQNHDCIDNEEEN